MFQINNINYTFIQNLCIFSHIGIGTKIYYVGTFSLLMMRESLYLFITFLIYLWENPINPCVYLMITAFLSSHAGLSCALCLNRPSLICFTKRCESISILFSICCCLLSLSLFSLSFSLSKSSPLMANLSTFSSLFCKEKKALNVLLNFQFKT